MIKFKLIFFIALIISVFVMIQISIFPDNPLTLLLIIPGMIVGFIIAVVLHELGHLIFGLISGYEFSSFKILFIKIYKRDRIRITFERFFLAIPGQCLMKPTNRKYLLYNMGGLIFSYLVSVISFISLYILSNILLIEFLFGVLFINTILVIINSIYKEDGINDICNIIRCRKNRDYLEGVLFQLDITCNAFNNDKFKSKYNPSDDVGDLISNISIYRLKYFKAYHEKNYIMMNHYYKLLRKKYRRIYIPFLKYPLLILLLNHEFTINNDIIEIDRLTRISKTEVMKLSKFKEEYELYLFYKNNVIQKECYDSNKLDKFIITNQNDLVSKLNNIMMSKVKRVYNAFARNDYNFK